MQRLHTTFVLILTLSGMLAPELSAQFSPTDIRNEAAVRKVVGEGRQLTPAQVADLEKAVEQNPDAQNQRAELLGFYFSHHSDTVSQTNNAKHVLWFIENHPENPVIGIPEGALRPEDPAFTKSKALWLEQLKDHAADTVVLWNAGRYFQSSDQDLARQSFEKGEALMPSEYRWPQELAFSYYLDKSTKTQAVAAYERALALAPENSRNGVLFWLVDVAYEASQWDKAKQYATALVESQSRIQRSKAAYVGHSVLGKLALRDGDVDGAKAQLLQSAAFDGPTVPLTLRMQLAAELLKLGQRDTVLSYFEECAKVFSPADKGKLAEWSVLVKNGLTPDFGPAASH